MRWVALFALLGTLAFAAAALATPRPVRGAAKAAMCAVAPPRGADVHCVSASISGVAVRWGRAVYTYRAGAGSVRRQRISWLKRSSARSGHWRFKTAVTSAVGADRPPCGRVPLGVLREYYGRRACG